MICFPMMKMMELMLLLIYIFTQQNVIVATKEIDKFNWVNIYLAVMNQYILINNIIDSWHETCGMPMIDHELFLH